MYSGKNSCGNRCFFYDIYEKKIIKESIWVEKCVILLCFILYIYFERWIMNFNIILSNIYDVIFRFIGFIRVDDNSFVFSMFFYFDVKWF